MKALICRTGGRSKTCISALETVKKKIFHVKRTREKKNDFVIKGGGKPHQIFPFSVKSHVCLLNIVSRELLLAIISVNPLKEIFILQEKC